MTSRLDDGFSSMLPAAPTGCGADGDWRNAGLEFEGVSLWPRPDEGGGRGGGDEDGEDDDDDYEGDEEVDCGLGTARRIGRNGRRCTVDGYGTCSSSSSSRRRRRSSSSSSSSDDNHSSS